MHYSYSYIYLDVYKCQQFVVNTHYASRFCINAKVITLRSIAIIIVPGIRCSDQDSLHDLSVVLVIMVTITESV